MRSIIPISSALLLFAYQTKIGMSLSLSPRVEKILSGLSLQEKIGQMIQVDINEILDVDDDGQAKLNIERAEYYLSEIGVGSIFNTPPLWTASEWQTTTSLLHSTSLQFSKTPLIFGIDSIHGANYVKGAIISPQPINIASTFNPHHAYLSARLGARDTRTAGIPWLFAPVLGLGVEPLWSRFYETFGEDPLVVSTMGVEYIKGIQVVGSAACAKHFLGYSAPKSGRDRSPSWIPERFLRDYFLESFKKAVDGGVLTLMASYTEVDGVPMTINHELSEKLLREEMGFEGVLVTDYNEIDNLVSWHKVVSDVGEGMKMAVKDAGINMMMMDKNAESFSIRMIDLVETGAIGMEKIDESVGRILTLKEKVGVLDGTVEGDIDEIGMESDRLNMLEIVKESIILAKNENSVLPILDNFRGVKVLVTGPTANELRYYSGGWTWSWQGDADDENFSYGEPLEKALSSTAYLDVNYECGVDVMGRDCESGPMEPSALDDVDYVIICVGEENYAEKNGDIDELSLPDGQYNFVRGIREQIQAEFSNTKIILVYFGGRPRLLKDMPDNADAVLLAFLPGPDAGEAIRSIITGEYNPSAKLPFTYPLHETSAPYYESVTNVCTVDNGEPLPHEGTQKCGVQYPFGHGLSYTSFSYTELFLSAATLFYKHPTEPNTVTLSVKVTNTGTVAGSDVVFIFSFDESRYVTPDSKRLRFFSKVDLEPQESRTISYVLDVEELKYIGHEDTKHKVIQNGMRFKLGVGHHADCRLEEGLNEGLCTDDITVEAGPKYSAVCDAACSVWADSPCRLREKKCLDMCADQGDRGWGWNYVDCIEAVAPNIEPAHSSIMDLLHNASLPHFDISSIDFSKYKIDQHTFEDLHLNFTLPNFTVPDFLSNHSFSATCSDMTVHCRNIFATPASTSLQGTAECIEYALDRDTVIIVTGLVYSISLFALVGLMIKDCCRRGRLRHKKLQAKVKANFEMTPLAGTTELA